MKFPYLDSISPVLSADQGIPYQDLLSLLQYAKKKGIILLFRPVEPIAKSLHETKQYPTKNFNIKGKSASWGAWAGFIPVNQGYSKLAEGADSVKINQYNQEVQNCIAAGHAFAVPFILSAQRFTELSQAGHISFKKQKGEYQVFQCLHPHTQEDVFFYVKEIKSQAKTEYAIFHEDQTPFQVLADPESKKPFIPDYDLLAVIFPWGEFGGQHIRSNPDVLYAKFFQKLSPKEQMNPQNDSHTFYAREKTNLGNITPEIIKILPEMNQALGRAPGLACIHHSDDIASPVSNPTLNYPITVLLPTELNINSPEIFQIKSPKAFVIFIKKIQKRGYRVELNPLWEESVQFAVRRRFLTQKFNIIWHYYQNGEDKTNIEADLKKTFDFIEEKNSVIKNKIIDFLFFMHGKNNKIKPNKYLSFIQACLLFDSKQRLQCCQLAEYFLSEKALTDKNLSSLLNFLFFFKEDIHALVELSGSKEKNQDLSTNFLNNLFELTDSYICKKKIDQGTFHNNLIKLLMNFVERAESEPEQGEKMTLSR